MRPHLPHPPLPITHAHDLTPNACLACASCSFSGDTWNTNLIISMATGVADTVVYSVGASTFDAAQLTAVLWLATVGMKFKDANWDVSSLKGQPIEKAIAAIGAYLAFA